MLSVIDAVCHIQALYAECHNPEWHYAECRKNVCLKQVYICLYSEYFSNSLSHPYEMSVNII